MYPLSDSRSRPAALDRSHRPRAIAFRRVVLPEALSPVTNVQGADVAELSMFTSTCSKQRKFSSFMLFTYNIRSSLGVGSPCTGNEGTRCRGNGALIGPIGVGGGESRVLKGGEPMGEGGARRGFGCLVGVPVEWLRSGWSWVGGLVWTVGRLPCGGPGLGLLAVSLRSAVMRGSSVHG